MTIEIPKFLDLSVGTVMGLKAEITPTDATDKNVYWSSNNPSVASIDVNGKVTANKTGWATITAMVWNIKDPMNNYSSI